MALTRAGPLLLEDVQASVAVRPVDPGLARLLSHAPEVVRQAAVRRQERRRVVEVPHSSHPGGGFRARARSTCGWRNWLCIGFASRTDATEGGDSSPSPRHPRLSDRWGAYEPTWRPSMIGALRAASV